MSKIVLVLALSSAWLWLWARLDTGTAHPLDPALLELWESREAAVEVLWRLPLAQPTNAPLHPVLPNGCREVSSPSVGQTGQSLTARWRIDCGAQSLVGARIGVQGLRERKTDALLRVHLADGRLIQAVLRGDSPFLTIPEQTRPLEVVRDYLELGFKHILTGLDHLLFVFGLVLLVSGRRPLLWTITAFTVGHSVTLSLATLGFVKVPAAPVEALIALSIFILAVELTRDARVSPTLMHRFPWAVALVFGLLHGLGFAGALAKAGFPIGEIPLALFAFNVGVELGQLVFVLLILAVRVVLHCLPIRWPKKSELVPAYAIGSLAAYWCFERLALLLRK